MLEGCAEKCLDDAGGVNWQLLYGKNQPHWFAWCHGAAGIGRFFLRAFSLTGDTRYRELGAAAAKAVASGGRRGGSTLCHGLAGNGSMLVDAYHVLGDDRWLDEAYSFGYLLELYARRAGEEVRWPAERPAVLTPDYMVGYAGTAAFLLRLADPARVRAHLTLPLL